MSELKVIQFKVQHMELMDIRNHEKELIFGQPGILERLGSIESLCDAGTITYKGIVLGVMGSMEWWPGVCEVWIIPSIYVKDHGVVFAKHVKRWLQKIEEVYKVHRIQVTALDDPFHDRWIEFFGFKSEGVLKKYSRLKQNYKMWARTK